MSYFSTHTNAPQISAIFSLYNFYNSNNSFSANRAFPLHVVLLIYCCWSVAKVEIFINMFYIHVIWSFFFVIYFKFMLYVKLYVYYVFICILCFFKFCYIFLFSHYLILNLCDNVFIFIVCTILITKKIFVL